LEYSRLPPFDKSIIWGSIGENARNTVEVKITPHAKRNFDRRIIHLYRVENLIARTGKARIAYEILVGREFLIGGALIKVHVPLLRKREGCTLLRYLTLKTIWVRSVDLL
jgi:hypothetical protein